MIPSSNRLCASKPGVGEHAEHLAVLGQHRRREAGDARLPGRDGQVLEEDRGDPPAVVGVVDEERHLGVAAGPVTVVAGDADQLVADDPDERHAIDVVDVGEPLQVAGRQAGSGREEPEVDALGRLALVEPLDERAVVGSHGPDVHGAAVGERDVGLPPRRVRGRIRIAGVGGSRLGRRWRADVDGRHLGHDPEATGRSPPVTGARLRHRTRPSESAAARCPARPDRTPTTGARRPSGLRGGDDRRQ